MANIIKNIFLSYMIAYVAFSFQNTIQSNFFDKFFKDNLITLLIALLAINITTLGVILTKIRDILDNANADGSYFKNTKKEMLLSIKEQIFLIGISTILLIAENAPLIKKCQYSDEIIKFINISLIAVFIYAILILYDTAKSVLNIIDI